MSDMKHYHILPFVFGGRSCYRYQVVRNGRVIAEGYADTEEAAVRLAERMMEDR